MAEATPKNDFVVGVDFGGTKILAAIFTPQLQNVGRAKISTKPNRGASTVIERIARCVRDAVDEADLSLKQVRGIGCTAPGAVDPDTGKVIFAPNLCWENVPLKKELEKLLEVPVFIENDCNLCALGVYEAELKAKPQTMIGIFLGTGIGAGVILGGKLFSGFNRTAGEVGHMVMQVNGPKCGCGSKGCFEALASRTAMFRDIKQAVKDGQKTILTDMLGDDLEGLRSGALRKAMRKGDKLVGKVVKAAAEYTGIAVANLNNLVNPEVFVLGGGIIDALEDEMMPIIIENAKKYAMPGTIKGVAILPSKLGDDAGITGAAALARQATR